MFSMPGGSEWLLILLVVMVVFGGKKIPEMMEGLGKGIRSFKKAMNEPDEIVTQAARVTESQPERRPR